MDKIIPKSAENFSINDIELSIDPTQISVYKEGLNYSWKTLRTKSSSKIINGNSIFHLKLQLIFTRSMLLELHRLICQTRNSPYVQINNQFISDAVYSLNTSKPTFFSLSSMQIVPRANSPYTVDVELDLRYFNHKIYSGDSLNFKEHFESKPFLKEGKTFVKTFDIFNENKLVDLEIEETVSNKNSKRKTKASFISEDLYKINPYNYTNQKRFAKDSKAYVRYSNFLQIKSFKENFAFTEEELKKYFSSENERDANGLHLSSLKDEFINKLFEKNNFYNFQITYQKYFTLNYTKDENKAIREYFDNNLKGIKSYSKRIEKTKELKENLLKSNDQNIKSVLDKINKISNNNNISMYTGRQNVNNVFYESKTLSLEYGSNPNQTTTVISNLSCGFQNIISTLPISGQEYPTHQFLGASEPMFNVNIIGAPDTLGNTGLSSEIIEFERMRKILLKNAVDFKIIPDAAYFSVDSFFTKLIGSINQYDIDILSNKPGNNFILKNFNIGTVEGMPGTQSLQFAFSETNNFSEEKIKPVYSFGKKRKNVTRLENKLKSISYVDTFKKSSKKVAAKERYEKFNWATKYFSFQEFYTPWVSQGRSLDLITEEQDKNAYNLCKNILDDIQEALSSYNKGKLHIMSSVDIPSTGKRKTASRHYSGSAVDVAVKDMSPIELMVFIYQARTVGDNLIANENVGVIGYYPSVSDYDNEKPMTAYGSKSHFVHIDSRQNVVRKNQEGNPTTTATASKTDTFEITNSRSSTFYAFDINNKLYKNIDGEPVEDILENYNHTAIDPIVNESTEIDEEEFESELERIITSTDQKEKINSRINPFGELETSFPNIDISVNKFSNLDEDVKKKLNEELTLNNTNPSLQVKILEGNTSELIKNLNEQGIKSILIDGKLYIPLTTSNVSTAKENEEAKALLNMYENLYLVASIMLTEPLLYLDNDEEIAEEKRRIRKELGFENIEPGMVTNMLLHILKIIDVDLYLTANYAFLGAEIGALGGSIYAGVGNVATSLAANIGQSAAAGATSGPAVIYAAVAVFLATSATTISNITSINAGKDVSALAIAYLIEQLKGKKINGEINFPLFNELLKLKNTKIEVDGTNNFLGYVGEQDETNLAFNDLLNFSLTESVGFSEFETSALSIKDNAKVLAALGNIDKIRKSEGRKDFKLEGLGSEELFVGELREIFKYCFGYSYVKGTFLKQEDFQDLYSVNSDFSISLSYPKEDYIPSNPKKSLIHGLAIEKKGTFPLTKAELKINQDKKIGYLKYLKDSILESLISISSVRKEFDITEVVSFEDFEEENTYPDIVLPCDPVNYTKNKNLHPNFYFWNYNDIYNEYKINPIMENNIRKIVEKSYDFSDALQTGIFSGSQELSERTKKTKTLEINKYSDFDNILRDKNYYTEEKDVPKVNGDVTQIAPHGTASPDTQDTLDEKINAFKNLKKTFDDIYGSAIDKNELSSIQNTTGFKQKEAVVQDTILACKNLMLPKKNIDKAFPTFKLYLIEEDSVESDKLSVYDDFYSYSGVKGFTVYSDRKLAASTASIQLQNISGILDGTKPEVVRDIDVDNNITAEEEQEIQASISSIVIRPGINIQLRAGYSANPNKLDIIFTGRITEVKNSSSGEMLEVIAQSFGVELVSKKYGLNDADEYQKDFYNTHSLLGTLALSEELRHFGRVKVGRKFQLNEGKFPSLDIDSNKDETWYNFSVTDWLSEVTSKYGIYILLGSSLIGGAGSLIRAAKPGKIITPIQNLLNSGQNTITNLINWQGTGTQLVAPTRWQQVSTFLLNATGKTFQKLFITIPSKTHYYISNLGRLNALKTLKADSIFAFGNLAKPGLTVSRGTKEALVNARTFNTIRNFFRKSPTSVAGGLTDAQLDAALLNQFGYNFCLKNKLLSNASLTTGQILQNNLSRTAFGSFSLVRNVAGIAMASFLVAAIIDAFVNIITKQSSDNLSPLLWGNQISPPKLKILLSPQDDNIFPPSPREYLVKINPWDQFLQDLKGTAWKNLVKPIYTFGFGVISYGLSGQFSDREKVKVLKNAYKRGDTRLSVTKKENYYKLTNSTIWDVLHEMSLRHPGYLYGIRKYGKGLESRIFFGKPTQRYFSKDLNQWEIETLNKIDNAGRKLSNGKVFKEDFIRDILSLDDETKIDKEQKTKEILNYWIEKTKERFVPYRQYHSIDSEHDIVNNGLRVENEQVINQVAVTYQGKDNETNLIKMKALPYLKESSIREKQVSFPNIKGVASASRYGLAELALSAKEMYSGEILIVGNPKINTDDVCILADDYLNMHGMIEVAGITHIFNHENGFLTEIKPNAVVLTKDNYSMNIMSGSLVFEAHRKLIDKHSDRNFIIKDNGIFNETELDKIVENTIISYFSDSDSGVYNYLYSSIPYLTDYKSLDEKTLNVIKKDIKTKLKAALENDEIIFLEDLTKNLSFTNVIPEAANTASNLGRSLLALGGGLLGRTIAGRIGLALTGGYLGSNIGDLAIKGVENSFKSGYLGRNQFRDILMTQPNADHLIKVLPLVKDGKPIVAGGYEYVLQKDRYKEVLGNYLNTTRDTVSGIRKKMRELEETAKFLGVSDYNTGLIGTGKGFLSVVGEYATGIDSEIIYMQMIEDD